MPERRRRYVLETVYEDHFKQYGSEIRCAECGTVLYEAEAMQDGGIAFDSAELERTDCACRKAAKTRRTSEKRTSTRPAYR